MPTGRQVVAAALESCAAHGDLYAQQGHAHYEQELLRETQVGALGMTRRPQYLLVIPSFYDNFEIPRERAKLKAMARSAGQSPVAFVNVHGSSRCWLHQVHRPSIQAHHLQRIRELLKHGCGIGSRRCPYRNHALRRTRRADHDLQ